jgi:hypothetical protein
VVGGSWRACGCGAAVRKQVGALRWRAGRGVAAAGDDARAVLQLAERPWRVACRYACAVQLGSGLECCARGRGGAARRRAAVGERAAAACWAGAADVACGEASWWRVALAFDGALAGG